DSSRPNDAAACAPMQKSWWVPSRSKRGSQQYRQQNKTGGGVVQPVPPAGQPQASVLGRESSRRGLAPAANRHTNANSWRGTTLGETSSPSGNAVMSGRIGQISPVSSEEQCRAKRPQ